MTPPSKNPRILHVITGLSTGGAEMMLLKLLSAGRERFCHEVISLKDEGTIGPRIKDLGVPVHSLGLQPLAPNPLSVFRLRSLVRQFQPDVIQGWMYHGNLIASLASTFSHPRIPVAWDVQQSVRDVADYGWMTANAIRLGAAISRNPAKIVYVSKIGAKQHEAIGYRPEGSVVIPNGIDCAAFRPDEDARPRFRAELGIPADSTLVGLVARYHPMKDHRGFLIAAGKIIQNHPSAYFILIGNGVTGNQPALRHLVEQHQLQDRAFLLGERQDTPFIMPALDIACSASAWGEALSVAIGEAMASGAPCAVTDVGDSAYLVADTGFSVPPSNPEALAGAIEQLILLGRDGRRRLGAAARRRVEAEFSLEAVSQRYEEIYFELASRTSAPAAVAVRERAAAQELESDERASQVTERPRRAGLADASNMRILHVITDVDTGGAQMMLLKLLFATHQRHPQAVVSLKNEGMIGPRIRELGVPIYSLRLRPLIPNLRRALSIKSLVADFQPDVIQGWMYHGNLMASLAGALSRNGAPVLWNVRQSLENIAVYRWRTAAVIKLGAWLSQYPSTIIYNSRSGAMHHQGFGFHNPRQIVIPNGFDCDVFRPDEKNRVRIREELGVSNGAVLVGLVARYDPVKHHQGFLQAAGLVARTHDNVRFVLVGKGVTDQESDLSKAIAKEGLQGRVFLLGERADVERVTCAFDIACSSSWSEGFSNAIGEAMACGVPCVVTDVGDSGFLVGNTGAAVPPASPKETVEEMALAISRLIDSGVEHRRQLGLAARRRVESEFSLQAVAGRYEQLYQDLVLRHLSALTF